jgi:hypothetical protein
MATEIIHFAYIQIIFGRIVNCLFINHSRSRNRLKSKRMSSWSHRCKRNLWLNRVACRLSKLRTRIHSLNKPSRVLKRRQTSSRPAIGKLLLITKLYKIKNAYFKKENCARIFNISIVSFQVKINVNLENI